MAMTTTWVVTVFGAGGGRSIILIIIIAALGLGNILPGLHTFICRTRDGWADGGGIWTRGVSG